MERQLATDAQAPVADGASKIGEAVGWGFLSASSLVLGASIALIRLPSRVVRASLMAFGGGALIEALSIELFAHIIEKARGHGHGTGDGGTVDRGLVFIALGSALAGGLIFAGLDKLLSGHGAFLRKASTVRTYMNRLQYALMKRMIARLQLVPMFQALQTAELVALTKSMLKERYAAGSTIFRELSGDSSVFFVLSGSVDLTVTTLYARTDPASPRLEQDKPLLSGDSPSCDDPTQKQEAAMDEVQDFFRLGPNDIFGDMALFTSDTVQATAVANKPTCVLRIPRTALHGLIASNQRLQDFITMTAIDRLQETDVFRHCTPSTVARLVSFMRQAELAAGEVLFNSVDESCPIYFVALGGIEVVHAGQSGARHVVGANGLLGTEHLVLGCAEHVTATAIESSTVLIVQRSDIEKLCARDERFRQALQSASTGASGGLTPGVATVALQPPEGSVGPTRFGVAADEMGWHRQGSPSKVDWSRQTTPVKLGWQRQTSPGSVGRSPAKAHKSEEADSVLPPKAVSGGCPDSESKAGEADVESGVRSPELSREMLPNNGMLPNQGSPRAVEGDLVDLLANQNAAQVAEGKEVHVIAPHDAGRGSQAAIMIWLGILIDSVPESLVMGILVNTASAGTLMAFVVGVFLANFPEAMSSAATMRAHGMRQLIIMVMWASIMLLTGIGAGIGALAFPPSSMDDPRLQKAIASIEGLCGGAMLCMIANTVLPEAFEQGGSVTGLSTLLGFLVAIAVSVSQ